MRILRLLFWLTLLGSWHQAALASSTARIAVASNFAVPMKALIKDFQSQHSGRIIASYASSGKLYAQIQHGAPFDGFFSADQDKVNRLASKNMAITGSQFTYAEGTLVLWSNDPKQPMVNQEILSGNTFNKLALANPKLAPYGLAAKQTLEHLNLITSTRTKWVMGENISQAFQFTLSGNAQLGFIALSQLLNSDRKSKNYWKVPKHFHKPIYQDAVLLQSGSENTIVKSFMTYMKSNRAINIIEEFGYSIPVRTNDS